MAGTTSRTSTSRTAIHEGDRRLRRAATRFGEEFRLIRLRTGVSQAAVARAIGVDRATICRMEAGLPAVSDRTRARAAAVLGADFRLAVYPDAAPLIHDAAHARLVEAFTRVAPDICACERTPANLALQDALVAQGVVAPLGPRRGTPAGTGTGGGDTTRRQRKRRYLRTFV